MKIGVLNLPIDNNYGGNLQRYALIKALQEMGHEVEHICLVFNFLPPRKALIKSFIIQLAKRILKGADMPIMHNIKAHYSYRNSIKKSDFYNTYVPHTRMVKEYKEIDVSRYDAIIVGSDQVWRKSMVQPYFGLANYFLGFVPDSLQKIGYGVSIGNYEEWTDNDIQTLLPLYNKLNALSVREYQSLDYLERNGFKNPKAQWVLDPTFLVDSSSYDEIISNSKTENLTKEKIFAYILDYSNNIDAIIRKQAEKHSLKYYRQGLGNSISIPQWLRNIKESQIVITDSYHGVVFSIIYRKPFLFLGNDRRGNARIDSLMSLFDVDKISNEKIYNLQNYNALVNKIQSSLDFIKQSLDV